MGGTMCFSLYTAAENAIFVESKFGNELEARLSEIFK